MSESTKEERRELQVMADGSNLDAEWRRIIKRVIDDADSLESTEARLAELIEGLEGDFMILLDVPMQQMLRALLEKAKAKP